MSISCFIGVTKSPFELLKFGWIPTSNRFESKFFNTLELWVAKNVPLIRSVDNFSMIKSSFLSSENVSENHDIPKYILKKVSEGRVNQNIINRKKFAFPFPINKWLSGKLGDFVKDTLLSKNIKSDFIINKKNVSNFLNKKSFNAKEDLDGKKIWMLLNIELWLQSKNF